MALWPLLRGPQNRGGSSEPPRPKSIFALAIALILAVAGFVAAATRNCCGPAVKRKAFDDTLIKKGADLAANRQLRRLPRRAGRRRQFVEETEFPEPPVRINTDLCDPVALGWEESAAWDEFVGYYGT